LSEFNINNHIETIYNFVDTERFNGIVEKCSKQHYAPNGEKLLLHTSNFRPVKRLTDTIKILAQVRKVLPAKLLLIGEGPDRQASHDMAKELNVLQDVIYLGTQDYIENLLACADLFLIPSEEESFGLAALEAMSAITPVIGSNIGGLPEVVDDSVNGFLHPVGDVDAMAKSIIKLLQNEKMLKEFGQKARQKAQDMFNIHAVIPQYENYYKKILEIGG
jgi:N-acetyl-alpha-D-glucosaminyl L-malate synthase BshA